MTAPEDPAKDPMELAFSEADAAAGRGEVPVGAVVVAPDGRVLAARGNEVEAGHDPTAHAEILAIRAAAKAAGEARLIDCDLYVTLEPCAMCAAALSHARIRRVVFAAYDAKGGGIDHGPRFFDQPTCHHRPEVVGGVQAGRAEALLKDFFAGKRDKP